MKKEKNSMKRKAIKSIAVILMIGIIEYSYPTEIRAASIQEASIEVRADQIGYRYKIINGKLHMRLYNYTKREWIGDWIPCN